MKDQDNDPITLHDAVAETVHLLSVVDLITNPNTENNHKALPEASEHIDGIEEFFDDLYDDFLKYDDSKDSETNRQIFIGNCFGQYRCEKLTRLTEFYRCLKTIEFYVDRRVKNLDPKVAAMVSDPDTIKELKADIMEELDEMSRHYDPEKPTDLQDLYMETSANLRPQLSDPISKTSETYTLITNFMNDVAREALMSLVQEFELIIAVATKYGSFSDSNFHDRHVHLNNLIVRVGAIAEPLINKPQWGQVDWDTTSQLGGTHKPLRPN
jgi:hypothetical protein